MADDKTPKAVSITNNDAGPRFVHSSKGQEVIGSGETLETTMSAVQIDTTKGDVIDDTDEKRFTVKAGTSAPKPPKVDTPASEKPLVEMTIAQLRKVKVNDQEVDFGDKVAQEDLIAAIEAARVEAARKAAEQ